MILLVLFIVDTNYFNYLYYYQSFFVYSNKYSFVSPFIIIIIINYQTSRHYNNFQELINHV